jgi:flagellar basal-body rod modification protein FlgD
MEIQPSSPQPVSPEQSGATNSKSTVTQDEFLMLLTTQLQYQDPLNPMDNTEFTAQLATFNSLDQLISINAKLDAVAAGQVALSQVQATAFIGKEVGAQGNSNYLGT